MNFPTLSKNFDASTYHMEVENPAIDPQNTDGGYLVTRPRYSRTPPKSFSFQFKDLSETDRTSLLTFWGQVGGSSLAFNWTDPTTGTVYNVRFDKGYTLQFVRTGYGTNNRYDTNTVMMKEV